MIKKGYSLYFKRLDNALLEGRVLDKGESDTLTFKFDKTAITFDTMNEPLCCERNYADWDTALEFVEDHLQYIARGQHKVKYVAVKTPEYGEYFIVYIGYTDSFSNRRKQLKMVVNCYGENTHYYSKHIALSISDLQEDKNTMFYIKTQERFEEQDDFGYYPEEDSWQIYDEFDGNEYMHDGSVKVTRFTSQD